MRGWRLTPGPWLALLVLLVAACEEKKSASTVPPAAQAPQATDLRVRQDAGGIAGSPTRVALTLAFTDPEGDVSTMEVTRQDTGEVMSLGLSDAGGKTLGLADATFEFTAAAPGNVPMTVALVDAAQNRSDTLPFVIGIQAPSPPPDEEPPAEEIRRAPASRSLRPLGARVRAR